MKTAVVTLRSAGPYSQSKHYVLDKIDNGRESAADFEKRTWRERLHRNEDGNVIIPPMQFVKSIQAAAAFLKERIKGKGQSTWTKHFERGITCTEPLVLPVKYTDVPPLWLFLPSDGMPGSGKRVDKCFGVIKEWKGDVTFFILDEEITQDVFTRHLEAAGKFVGIGFFRPERRGYWGRFEVVKVKWS